VFEPVTWVPERIAIREIEFYALIDLILERLSEVNKNLEKENDWED